MRAVAAALIVAALAGGTVARVSSQDPPRFRARIDAVRVSAMVTDKGRPVTGLTRRDFDILDNGVPQAVDLVDRESLGLDVMLALDNSSSIWKRALQVPLTAAAVAALTELRRGDRAGLVLFGHHVSVQAALTPDIPSIASSLYAAPRGGGTALHDAVIASIVAASPAADRRTLLLVYTDGIDTVSWHSPTEVLSTLERSDLVVCAVVPKKSREIRREARLGDYPSAWQFLTELTSRSGGELIEVDDSGLSRAFRSIVQRFGQGYQLVFHPADAGRRGWHTLDVRLRGRTGQVKARRGYYVE